MSKPHYRAFATMHYPGDPGVPVLVLRPGERPPCPKPAEPTPKPGPGPVGMLPVEIDFALAMAGSSQAQIARQLNVSNSCVCAIVNNRQRSKRVRSAIAQATGIPVTKLWPNSARGDSGSHGNAVSSPPSRLKAASKTDASQKGIPAAHGGAPAKKRRSAASGS